MTVWPDDMILTRAHADELMARGACRAALHYVGRTVRSAARADPASAMGYAADLLMPETLDCFARTDPLAALMYAAGKLTPETIAHCRARVGGDQ